MTLAEAVAIRTKDLLKKNNISQYKLIKESCLDKTTIQAIFKNKTKDIKLSTILSIIDVLGMSFSEFFNDEVFERKNLDFI